MHPDYTPSSTEPQEHAEHRKAAQGVLNARWAHVGFDQLTHEERETIALFWLEGEVMNGGLHQYFVNSSGDLAPLAASALQRLGATQSLCLLNAAIAKLSSAHYPCDREARAGILDGLGWDVDPFDTETNALQRLPEDFYDLALDDLHRRYAEPSWEEVIAALPKPVKRPKRRRGRDA